jgi:hypothetical protein
MTTEEDIPKLFAAAFELESRLKSIEAMNDVLFEEARENRQKVEQIEKKVKALEKEEIRRKREKIWES